MNLFHKHKWSKWSDPIPTMGSDVKVQVRYCEECNKCHAKKIIQPWNTWFGVPSSAEVLK